MDASVVDNPTRPLANDASDMIVVQGRRLAAPGEASSFSR